jgi:hypothetical protein
MIINVYSLNNAIREIKKGFHIKNWISVRDLGYEHLYKDIDENASNILKITFDDSLIEDKESESVRARAEVSAGLKSKVEYRVDIYGETEEVAKQKIAEIEESNPSVKDLLGTNNEE